MADAVDPGKVLAWSLADCQAYWLALGTLTAAQKRWREHEREWRTNLAAQGLLPAEWLVADIRSGAKERRDRQSMQNLLRDRARLASLKQAGYSFDAEHRLVAPALTRIHVPALRPGERPRERRSSTRSSGRPSRGDPDPEPEPPPVEVWRGVRAASVRMHTRLARQRAKWAAV